MKHHHTKNPLIPATTLAATLLITLAIACGPAPTPEPPLQDFSPVCRMMYDRSYSRAKLDAQVCDLYEKIASLEKRVADIENTRQRNP